MTEDQCKLARLEKLMEQFDQRDIEISAELYKKKRDGDEVDYRNFYGTQDALCSWFTVEARKLLKL
jgi:hypothetical protein